jgi:hypothetical protein
MGSIEVYEDLRNWNVGKDRLKAHEQKLREELPPYTLVLTSGERVKVRSHDHIFFPPTENQNGRRLADRERSDFFQVWGDGRAFRWVSFATISAIETRAPSANGDTRTASSD